MCARWDAPGNLPRLRWLATVVLRCNTISAAGGRSRRRALQRNSQIPPATAAGTTRDCSMATPAATPPTKLHCNSAESFNAAPTKLHCSLGGVRSVPRRGFSSLAVLQCSPTVPQKSFNAAPPACALQHRRRAAPAFGLRAALQQRWQAQAASRASPGLGAALQLRRLQWSASPFLSIGTEKRRLEEEKKRGGRTSGGEDERRR